MGVHTLWSCKSHQLGPDLIRTWKGVVAATPLDVPKEIYRCQSHQLYCNFCSLVCKKSRRYSMPATRLSSATVTLGRPYWTLLRQLLWRRDYVNLLLWDSTSDLSSWAVHLGICAQTDPFQRTLQHIV